MNNQRGKRILPAFLIITTLIIFILAYFYSIQFSKKNEKTTQNKLTLLLLKDKLAIFRLDSKTDIPDSLHNIQSSFLSITRTLDELSIVCNENLVPKNIQAVTGWYAFKVEGPLDFSLTGILSSLLEPLAKGKISIFAVSTYDTDYILVKEESLEKAIEVLKKKYIIKTPNLY